MKKFISALLIFVFCGTAAYAMDLDGLKTHFLKGEWKDAIREGEALLARANRNSPDLDQLYYYLALSYMKERNYLRASDICEIIVKEFSSSKYVPHAHYVLIDACAGNDDYAGAQANAESFLKKYPRSEHAGEVEAKALKFKSRAGSQSVPKPAAPVLKPAQPQAPEVVSAPAETPGQDGPEPDIVLAPELLAGSGRADDAGAFWIQVGAFSNGRNADNLVSKLRAASYTATVSQSVSNGNSIYKVRVGSYPSREEALIVSNKLSRQGYPTKVIP